MESAGVVPDKKALKILNDTYWSSAGWRPNEITSREDLAYAKWAGIMFDRETISHDEGVRRAREAIQCADMSVVAKAFVASLSSRRLDHRSALGSFAIGQFPPDHSFTDTGGPCPICDVLRSKGPTDLNVLNFERFKWGGVRHSDPVYVAFDLKLFSQETIEEPSAESIDILRALVSTAKSIAPGARARDLERR